MVLRGWGWGHTASVARGGCSPSEKRRADVVDWAIALQTQVGRDLWQVFARRLDALVQSLQPPSSYSIETLRDILSTDITRDGRRADTFTQRPDLFSSRCFELTPNLATHVKCFNIGHHVASGAHGTTINPVAHALESGSRRSPMRPNADPTVS